MRGYENRHFLHSLYRILEPVMFGLAVVVLVVVTLIATPAEETRADGPVTSQAEKTAYVVVDLENGDRRIRPITFTDQITYIGMLLETDLDVVVNGDASAVCAIEGSGCTTDPINDCFCPDNWWAVSRWTGTDWEQPFPFPVISQADTIIGYGNGQPWPQTPPHPAPLVAASKALAWMRNQQQSDGSYQDAFGTDSASVRALIAVGANGYDPSDWRNGAGNPSLLDYVSGTVAPGYAARNAASAGKLTVGAAWTVQNVDSFGGVSLPLSITSYFNPTTGSYGGGAIDQAWAMLGLYAAGETIPHTATQYLKSLQLDDGGWNWNSDPNNSSETQLTASCLQALLAAEETVTATEVVNALNFLRSAQNSDGGYAYVPPGNSDIDATAFAIQALLSAGQDPPGNWCGPVGAAYLLRVQQEDGRFDAYSDLFATQEAISALMYRPYGPFSVWDHGCQMRWLPIIFQND